MKDPTLDKFNQAAGQPAARFIPAALVLQLPLSILYSTLLSFVPNGSKAALYGRDERLCIDARTATNSINPPTRVSGLRILLAPRRGRDARKVEMCVY